MSAADKAGVFSCDSLGCTAILPGGRKIAYIRRRDAFQEDCLLADIVVTQIPLQRHLCSAPWLIDRYDLKRNGAYALYVPEHGDIQVRHAAGMEGNRPWGRHARRSGQNTTKSRQRRLRAQKTVSNGGSVRPGIPAP